MIFLLYVLILTYHLYKIKVGIKENKKIYWEILLSFAWFCLIVFELLKRFNLL